MLAEQVSLQFLNDFETSGLLSKDESQNFQENVKIYLS
jgi:hypothetical protein